MYQRSSRSLYITISLLGLRRVCREGGWDGEALVAGVVEADDLAAEDAGDVLAPAEAGPEGRHRPVRHVERRVHHRTLVLLRRLLKGGEEDYMGPMLLFKLKEVRAR